MGGRPHIPSMPYGCSKLSRAMCLGQIRIPNSPSTETSCGISHLSHQASSAQQKKATKENLPFNVMVKPNTKGCTTYNKGGCFTATAETSRMAFADP